MATLDQIQDFVPTRTNDERAIYGKLNTPLKKGNFVQYKDNGAGANEAFNAREVEPANGTAGFYLTRDCGPADECKRLADYVQGTQKHFHNDFIVGESTVTGHGIYEGIWEGDDQLDASITPALPAGTELTTKEGKLAEKTSDDEELVGHIRMQLAPTVGGTTRIRASIIAQ